MNENKADNKAAIEGEKELNIELTEILTEVVRVNGNDGFNIQGLEEILQLFKKWHNKLSSPSPVQGISKEGDRACPCLYLDEPCHPRCTCRNGASSLGCIYCCTYGSLEQRAENAKRIAAKLSPPSPAQGINLKKLQERFDILFENEDANSFEQWLKEKKLKEGVQGISKEGWISVEYRLPETKEDSYGVFVYPNNTSCAYGEFEDAQHGDVNKKGFYKFSQYWGGCVEVIGVTHWRPLPAPPGASSPSQTGEEKLTVSMEEYNDAIGEIGQLQEQLKEAEQEIRDLEKGCDH